MIHNCTRLIPDQNVAFKGAREKRWLSTWFQTSTSACFPPTWPRKRPRNESSYHCRQRKAAKTSLARRFRHRKAFFLRLHVRESFRVDESGGKLIVTSDPSISRSVDRSAQSAAPVPILHRLERGYGLHQQLLAVRPRLDEHRLARRRHTLQRPPGDGPCREFLLGLGLRHFRRRLLTCCPHLSPLSL